MGLDLPGLALAERLYQAAREQGYGQKGTHALIVPLARKSGVDPRSGASDRPANDEERDRHVLARDRDDGRRVEDLVVPEHPGTGSGRRRNA